MIIYVDILLILNLFVDYFLLLGCCVLLKINVSKARLVFGAIIGSGFSLLIFIIDFNFFIFIFLKIVSALILILITFGYRTKLVFLKIFLVFLMESFVFAGTMFCLWVLFSPPGMLWQNGITYIAISPTILILGSVVAYFLTCLFNIIFSKRISNQKIYLIKIGCFNKFIEINALYDTGNCLIEPFSKKPVCVCELNLFKNILPADLFKFFNDISSYNFSEFNVKTFKNVKLVPCNTIKGSSILPAFLPESFIIYYDKVEIVHDCYIGLVNSKLSDGEFQAIIGDFK